MNFDPQIWTLEELASQSQQCNCTNFMIVVSNKLGTWTICNLRSPLPSATAGNMIISQCTKHSKWSLAIIVLVWHFPCASTSQNIVKNAFAKTRMPLPEISDPAKQVLRRWAARYRTSLWPFILSFFHHPFPVVSIFRKWRLMAEELLEQFFYRPITGCCYLAHYTFYKIICQITFMAKQTDIQVSSY